MGAYTDCPGIGREREREMAKGILTGLILCIIILETVLVAEAADLPRIYSECVENCKTGCKKKFIKFVCEASCKYSICKKSSPGGSINDPGGKMRRRGRRHGWP